MVRPSDTLVEELARRVLKNDSRVDVSEIQVTVEDGVVYLSGTVDSAAERRAAREDLLAAPEVGQVVDDLKLRNYIERTDEELREAVKRALIRDIDVDPRRIEIQASRGAVILGGLVPSYAQKAEAESVAWWTSGVVEVTNRLEVDGQLEPADGLD